MQGFPAAVVAGALGLLFLAPTTTAQGQAKLAQRRDQKLAESWLKNASWILDYDNAKATSAKTGKVIFGYFVGEAIVDLAPPRHHC